MGRVLVAGEDDIEATFFVVSPVNQVEEQSGILPVELTAAYLINNQARWTHEAVENSGFLSSPPFLSKLIVIERQCRHL